MNPKRQQKLGIILGATLLVGVGITFILVALQNNIQLYLTPSEVLTRSQLPNVIRIGGLVVEKSVKRQNLQVTFQLTDFKDTISVRYTGVLPALFREGQGIVAEGHWQNGWLIATQVLAKHDENYHPPKIPQRKTA